MEKDYYATSKTIGNHVQRGNVSYAADGKVYTYPIQDAIPCPNGTVHPQNYADWTDEERAAAYKKFYAAEEVKKRKEEKEQEYFRNILYAARNTKAADGGPGETISVPKAAFQAVFDIAIGSMDFGSGFLADEEHEALVVAALLLGLDPWVGVQQNMRCMYRAKLAGLTEPVHELTAWYPFQYPKPHEGRYCKDCNGAREERPLSAEAQP